MALFAPDSNIKNELTDDRQCNSGKCVGSVEINGDCYGAGGNLALPGWVGPISFINRTQTDINLTIITKALAGPSVGTCSVSLERSPACGSVGTFIPYLSDICLAWESDSSKPRTIKYVPGCDICVTATVSFEKFELDPWPGEDVPEHIKSNLEDILYKSYDVQLEGNESGASGEIILDPINIAPYSLSLPPGGSPAPGNEAPYGDIWTPTITVNVNTNDKTMSANFSIGGSVNIFGIGGPLLLSMLQSIDGNNSQIVSQVPSIGGWISLYDSYLSGNPPLEGYIDFSESIMNVSIPYKWSQLF